MNDEQLKASLSQIETSWSLIVQAHQGQGDATSSARCELMVRYAGAVQRYLSYVTRSPDIAADLGQEFALRFLRGDFHNADPRRGRFRSYVKSAVLNLIADYHRRRRSQPGPLPDGGIDLADPSENTIESEQQFLDCWREEILSRAWERLARHQDKTGQPFYTVLRHRAEHPSLRSQELADRLSAALGKPVTAGWVRQNLRRARERFVEFVQAEVSHSLGNPDAEERDEEMRNLGLWSYCRVERS